MFDGLPLHRLIYVSRSDAAGRLTRFWGYVHHYREGNEKAHKKAKGLRPAPVSHQLHPLSQGSGKPPAQQRPGPLPGQSHHTILDTACQFIPPAGRREFRADPEITRVPITPSNFAPDEGNLTRHTWCIVREIDEVWHKICKQVVRW